MSSLVDSVRNAKKVNDVIKKENCELNSELGETNSLNSVLDQNNMKTIRGNLRFLFCFCFLCFVCYMFFCATKNLLVNKFLIKYIEILYKMLCIISKVNKIYTCMWKITLA